MNKIFYTICSLLIIGYSFVFFMLAGSMLYPEPDPEPETWFYITNRFGDTLECNTNGECKQIINGLWEKKPLESMIPYLTYQTPLKTQF